MRVHVGRCKLEEGGADLVTPLPQAVHPCKIARGRVKISYGGVERDHEVRGCSVAALLGLKRYQKGSPTLTMLTHSQGRYDILPITDDMEWVPAGYGELPKGRRPVEGVRNGTCARALTPQLP